MLKRCALFAAVLSAGVLGSGAAPAKPATCATQRARFELPDPDPHVLHVTHAWPHCGPCVKLSPRPAFLVRVDGVVDPAAVLSSIFIVGGPVEGWRKLSWTLKACVTEKSDRGVATTILFQPSEPLPPGVYDWYLPDEVAKALHWGLSTVNMQAGGVFVVGEPLGERHPMPSLSAMLGAGRDPAEIYGHLRNARESLKMIREWGDLEVPRAVDLELEAMEAEFRSLQGDAGQPVPLFTPMPARK